MFWTDAIPLTQLSATLQPRAPWRHDEPALALRGALGAAVVRRFCQQPKLDCAPCPHRSGCLVPGWYDPGLVGATGVRPFWLRVDGGGGELDADSPLRFAWTFLGQPPEPNLPIQAVTDAATAGLGAERVPHDVVSIDVRAGPLTASLGPSFAGPATLRTRSRLALRRDGRVDRRPTLARVIGAAIVRVRELERALGVRSERRWPSVEVATPPRSCRWVAASRWSSRQEREVDLSGVEAEWEVPAEIVASHGDLLRALPALSLGRSTSAGMGGVAFERSFG